MSGLTEVEIIALCARWRARAKHFERQIGRSRNVRDVARWAGMSTALEWALDDLCFAARIDPTEVGCADLDDPEAE
jgi:hypothetical protein